MFSAYRKCQPEDVRCGPPTTGVGNGLCVAKEKRCDGYMDCRSGLDEDKCGLDFGVSCQLDQFRCANKEKCIDTSLKCNHKNDCGDNSDEEGCSKYYSYRCLPRRESLNLKLSFK